MPSLLLSASVVPETGAPCVSLAANVDIVPMNPQHCRNLAHALELAAQEAEEYAGVYDALRRQDGYDQQEAMRLLNEYRSMYHKMNYRSE